MMITAKAVQQGGLTWVSAAWVIAALILSTPASVAAAPAPAALCFVPTDWVGRYPSESTATYPRFLDLPCVRDPLKAMLSTADFRLIMHGLAVASPIQMSGPYLIVALCQAHDCPAENAMVVIDTERINYMVGLYRRSSLGSVTRWYAREGDPLELPKEILEQFLRRHIAAP